MAIVEIVSETGTVSIVDGTETVVQTIELQVQSAPQTIEILVGTQGPAGTPGSNNASQITSTPIGDVSAINVQSAIAELSTEKARRSYNRAFTQADLSVVNILAVTHGFGVYPASVVVWDNTSEIITPDDVTYVNLNSLSMNFSAYAPIGGTYTVVVSE